MTPFVEPTMIRGYLDHLIYILNAIRALHFEKLNQKDCFQIIGDCSFTIEMVYYTNDRLLSDDWEFQTYNNWM